MQSVSLTTVPSVIPLVMISGKPSSTKTCAVMNSPEQKPLEAAEAEAAEALAEAAADPPVKVQAIMMRFTWSKILRPRRVRNPLFRMLMIKAISRSLRQKVCLIRLVILNTPKSEVA